MTYRIPKTNGSEYPPIPIGEVSYTDGSAQSVDQANDIEPAYTNRRKQKKEPRKSRVARGSQIGHQISKPHRISIQQMQNKNNYFQNTTSKARCKGCGQMTQSIIDYHPGCLAFTTCILLSPLGMGSCLVPFFVKGCLDIEQRCAQCEYVKRMRRATCCH